MRYHEIIDEDINKKEWVFYHGTKSDAFDVFAPHRADKGEQFWNPLGNGMYATNNPRFAANFGPNVHEVVIPPGCAYKRINHNQWTETGFSLVMRALKKAFKAAGDNFETWERGVRMFGSITKKMSREDMIENIIRYYRITRYGWKEEDEIRVRQAAEQMDDAALLQDLKYKASIAPRIRDEKKGRKILEFRIELRRLMKRLSPYESLYESGGLVEIMFGEKIAEAYEEVLPRVSDDTFGKYDFVVFTETNDVLGDDNGRSSLEVVIFNPALQRTRPRTRRAA